jgi:hypothetical protein
MKISHSVPFGTRNVKGRFVEKATTHIVWSTLVFRKSCRWWDYVKTFPEGKSAGPRRRPPTHLVPMLKKGFCFNLTPLHFCVLMACFRVNFAFLLLKLHSFRGLYYLWISMLSLRALYPPFIFTLLLYWSNVKRLAHRPCCQRRGAADDRLLELWDRIQPRGSILSVVSVLCCPVEVSVSGVLRSVVWSWGGKKRL